MKYDKIQLLKDAFACKETFKVPTGFWHHFVLGPDQFRADKDAAIRDRIVEGHRKYYELVDPDMMKMMNEGFMGYPPIMDNPLETEADLMRERLSADRRKLFLFPYPTRDIPISRALVSLARPRSHFCRYLRARTISLSVRWTQQALFPPMN